MWAHFPYIGHLVALRATGRLELTADDTVCGQPFQENPPMAQNDTPNLFDLEQRVSQELDELLTIRSRLAELTYTLTGQNFGAPSPPPSAEAEKEPAGILARLRYLTGALGTTRREVVELVRLIECAILRDASDFDHGTPAKDVPYKRPGPLGGSVGVSLGNRHGQER